jgi:hypothetical protein
LELPFDEPPLEEPPPEEPPPEEEELLLELLELELLELVEEPPLELEEPPLEEELLELELEDPPPEEDAAGSPKSARACCRCRTTVLRDGPSVVTAIRTASPIAAPINAYSTAALPAMSLTMFPRPQMNTRYIIFDANTKNSQSVTLAQLKTRPNSL